MRAGRYNAQNVTIFAPRHILYTQHSAVNVRADNGKIDNCVRKDFFQLHPKLYLYGRVVKLTKLFV